MLIQFNRAPTEAEAKAITDALGVKNKNDNPVWPLPNMSKITSMVFWKHWFIYGFKAEAHISSFELNDTSATLKIFWVDDDQLLGGGYAITREFRTWNRSVLSFYKWRACEHTFIERNLGRCYNEYKCSKCHRSYTIDSGD